MNVTDTYKTIATPSIEVLFKEKKSKFYGYAFPITSESDVKPIIELLKKKHHTANHVCFAWQLGVEQIRYRANDDGEPNNSAGIPIYGQIQSFKVTNILIAIARIFGGTKLGVGGLISAYKTTAQLTLEAAPIIEKVLVHKFKISFEYEHMDKVMRVIKQHQLKITSQDLTTKCNYTISVRKQLAEQVIHIFSSMHYITVQKNF